MMFLSHGISDRYRVTLTFAVSMPLNCLVIQYIEVFHALVSSLIKITYGIWDLCSQETVWICMRLERSERGSSSGILSASMLAV